jgi:hypothetical protein
MENKEIKDVSEFFSKEHPELTPQQKWDRIFEGWINKIDEKKLMPSLFELKTWFEAMEEFFSSTYLENMVFKYRLPIPGITNSISSPLTTWQVRSSAISKTSTLKKTGTS